VVVFSGYSNDPVMSHLTDYGFNDVVYKPFIIENVGRVLKNVLKK